MVVPLIWKNIVDDTEVQLCRVACEELAYTLRHRQIALANAAARGLEEAHALAIGAGNHRAVVEAAYHFVYLVEEKQHWQREQAFLNDVVVSHILQHLLHRLHVLHHEHLTHKRAELVVEDLMHLQCLAIPREIHAWHLRGQTLVGWLRAPYFRLRQLRRHLRTTRRRHRSVCRLRHLCRLCRFEFHLWTSFYQSVVVAATLTSYPSPALSTTSIFTVSIFIAFTTRWRRRWGRVCKGCVVRHQ